MTLNDFNNFLLRITNLESKKLFFVLIPLFLEIVDKFLLGSMPNTLNPFFLKKCKKIPSLDPISHIESILLFKPYLIIKLSEYFFK